MEEYELPAEEGTPENTHHQETIKEETQPLPSMESLLAQEDIGLDFPKQGETREGTIVSINENEILVGVGTKSEGIIPARELEQLTPEEREKFQVGESITVFVVSPEDQHGNLLLSYVRALEENDWQQAEELLESGEVYEGTIEGYNKGGLIVHMGMLRGFVPGSQVSLSRRMAYSGKSPDQRWGKMVGEPIATRVIEVDRSRRRLILSERAALQEARELLKERLLEELEVGQVRKGRVTSLADFGAFVNINGADGLVHLTEISWERINHPTEVLKVGQEVTVKVIEIDRERKRIGLSIRQLQEDPWPQKISNLRVGQLVEGEIVRLVKFGAFARLDDFDVEGLIHISEISDQRIEHPKEVLHENEVVTLRVINIDKERHRIGLSLRKVDSPAYADLDWELALAEDKGAKVEEGPEEEIPQEAEEATEVLEEEIPQEAEEATEVLEEEIPQETQQEVSASDEEAVIQPVAELTESSPAENLPEGVVEDPPSQEPEAEPSSPPEAEPSERSVSSGEDEIAPE